VFEQAGMYNLVKHVIDVSLKNEKIICLYRVIMQLYLHMGKREVAKLLRWKVTNISSFRTENLHKHSLKAEIMKV
jgi:hypothetical protein